MKFKKEDLIKLLWKDEVNDLKKVRSELIDETGRWENDYELIFEFENKLYATVYRKAPLGGRLLGKTECQENLPFEYEDDEIECPEVEPVEKTIIEYVVKK